MTPREIDPVVWATTYAVEFTRCFESHYSAGCGPHDVRRDTALGRIDAAECAIVADAAVRALHPSEFDPIVSDRGARLHEARR